MKKLLIILSVIILSCTNNSNQELDNTENSITENEKVNYYNVLYLVNTNSGEYVNIEISYDNYDNNDTNFGYILYSDTNQDTIVYNIEKIDENNIHARSYDNRMLEGNIPTEDSTFYAKIDGKENSFNTVNVNIKDIKIVEYSFFNTYKNNENENVNFKYENSILIIKEDSNNDIINKINMNINKEFNIKDVAIFYEKNNNLHQYIKRSMENEYNTWKNEEIVYDMEILANRYSIDYISDDIISLNNFVYEYTGGAHGNYYTINEVYSLKTGDKINIEDIIEDVNNQDLINIIKQKLLSIRDNSLYFNLDDISIESNNFYITYNGIVFTWGIYEIAPYSEGETRILLSKKEIEPFLKEKYKHIIN